MVYQNTFLKIADNSGPKEVKCLNIKKKFIGYISDILVVIIKKKFVQRKKVKKSVLPSLLINTRFKNKRPEGIFIKFRFNSSLLLNKDLIFLGTNVKHLLCKEIKKSKKQFKKIISYSSGNV